MQNISLKQELYRKLIHLSSLWIPICYLFLDKLTMIYLLSLTNISCFGIEYLRKYIAPLNNLYIFLWQHVLRSHEIKFRFSGGSYLFLSALIVIFFFEKSIAINSLLILIISDSLAAIIGKKYGRYKIKNKSIEGAIAFFISATVIVIVTNLSIENNFSLSKILICVLLTTFVELFVTKIDDNFTIPISFCLFTSI